MNCLLGFFLGQYESSLEVSILIHIFSNSHPTPTPKDTSLGPTFHSEGFQAQILSYS